MTEPVCGCADTGCGCSALTPLGIADTALFRHGAIKARMLARIATEDIDGLRPLANLGTRSDDDPAIALIDAWAASLHVLSWTTRRLYDDGTISGTEDTVALTALTGMLGYRPRPAIAAETPIAVTLDALPGSPPLAILPQGSRIASIPGPSEMPVTFETDALLEVQAAWNTLVPRPVPAPPLIGTTTASLTVTGSTTPAKVGDMVLVWRNPQVAGAEWLLARISAVDRQPALAPPRTVLTLTAAAVIAAPPDLTGAGFAGTVLILGQRAQAFGANAPDLSLLSNDIRNSQKAVPTTRPTPPLPTEWRDLLMTPAPLATGGTLHLDAVYPDAAPAKAVVFATLGTVPTDLGTITSVSEGSVKGFGLSGRTSRIAVAGIDLTTGLNALVRETVIHLETVREALWVPVADVQTPDPATPDRITVSGSVLMPPGRQLILTGTAWTTGGPASEIAVVASATLIAATATTPAATLLVMEAALQTTFHSDGLTILGNCVPASQGETPVAGAEVIGSGDPSTPTPRFALKLHPLAHLAAAASPGYAPAIEVRVAGRRYDPVRSIFGLPEESRAFQITQTGDGASVVQFAGRLPGGTGNVTALYRKGGGVAGLLEAGRLTTLLTPVIGVRSVTNPLPTTGGMDAETLDQMRLAAPASIRTLDRVVSLADYQSFAQTYPGVGKALATELRSGMRRLVCLTIATGTFLPPVPGSPLPAALTAALALVTVPGRSLMIAGFTALSAQVTLGLATDPALDRVAVEAAVRARVCLDFSAAVRGFGQGLHRSELMESAQSVPGVMAVTIPVFALSAGPGAGPGAGAGPGGGETDGRLPCPGPAMAGGVFVPAGLLSLSADQIAFEQVAP